jgi:hypothetical protein
MIAALALVGFLERDKRPVKVEVIGSMTTRCHRNHYLSGPS